MLYIGFAFNFNIQRCEVAVGDEAIIIKEGYKPLIEVLLKNGIKADLFISGYTSELFKILDPEIIDIIRSGVLPSNISGNFELGTYTYTHPIPQLLNRRELEQQIFKGLEIDKSTYGINPTGFLPPEFAYSRDIAETLVGAGLKWMVVLAKSMETAVVIDTGEASPKTANSYGQTDRSQGKKLSKQELYYPATAVAGKKEITVIPAVYQLPGTPQRFFKLMMKGEIPVKTVIQGIKEFQKQYPDKLLLFKRDAETIFIDRLNSGFKHTKEVFKEFAESLASLSDIHLTTIGDFIKGHPPVKRISLNDHLGNTKIETFTEDTAKEIWDLTVKVRELLMKAERENPESDKVKQAWEHLLLSHNSDGRIGYWFSEWNPGEHRVEPSRKKFIEEHLNSALDLLKAV